MKLNSRPDLNFIISTCILLAGLPLVWLGRNYSGYSDNQFAAFCMGSFMVILGLFTLVVREKRSIELDEEHKRIVIDIKRRFWKCQHIVIPFNQITNFTILRQGKSSNFSVYYDLGVVLRNGKTIYLFGGSAFDGRMSEQFIENLKMQFEQAVSL